MADRTSAGIFGELFELLAKQPRDARTKKLAKAVWKLSRGYDFCDYQMDADGALIKLGLARTGLDDRYPEDGEILLYGEDT